MSEDNSDVPFQVRQLMDAMKNKQERVNIRGNYRTRLLNIKEAIDHALKDYDLEMGAAQPLRRKTNGRR